MISLFLPMILRIPSSFILRNETLNKEFNSLNKTLKIISFAVKPMFVKFLIKNEESKYFSTSASGLKK